MTYELHDDNGTPNDESDDVVVGWMVMELYDVSLFGGTAISTYFDLDGNEVQEYEIDYDHMELINTETLGGIFGTPTIPDSIIDKPTAKNQIPEIAAKSKEAKGKIATSGLSTEEFSNLLQQMNQATTNIENSIPKGIFDGEPCAACHPSHKRPGQGNIHNSPSSGIDTFANNAKLRFMVHEWIELHYIDENGKLVIKELHFYPGEISHKFLTSTIAPPENMDPKDYIIRDRDTGDNRVGVTLQSFPITMEEAIVIQQMWNKLEEQRTSSMPKKIALSYTIINNCITNTSFFWLVIKPSRNRIIPPGFDHDKFFYGHPGGARP